MTWSGSTGPDLKSLDRFAGYSVVKKNAEGETSVVENSEDDNSEAWPTAETLRLRSRLENTSAITSADIGIPQQSDLQYFLDPETGLEMEGPPAPPPKPVVHRSRQEVCESLVEAAQSNDLPTPFFIRLLQQESGFKPGVVSPVGAQGVAQFMPGTAAEMGVDNPFDPLEAIPASARLLKNLFQKFGNLGLAAAAYNAGPKRIQEWLAKKGKLPDETRGYVRTITGHEAESWKVAAAGISNIKLPRVAPCQHDAGLHAWNGPKDIPMPPPSPRNAEVTQAMAPKNGDKSTTGQLAAHKTTKTSLKTAQAKSEPVKSVKNDSPKSGKNVSKKPGKPLQLAEAHR